MTLLYWLLSSALLYLLGTSLILARNRYELTSLPKKSESGSHKISVCIPARNEEKNIGQLLDAVCTQSYNHFDVHVLDDQSTDSTPSILNEYSQKFPGLLNVYKGKDKPDDWVGKPWACSQLAEKSDGDILLFLDADTIPEPGFLSRTEQAFSEYQLDMLTVWPRQIMKSFWEQAVLPIVYYSFLTILPTIYVYRKPRWMPASLYRRMASVFAAACGQCIAFTRTAYQCIGGHQSVKSIVLEDVEIARQTRRKGLHLRMFEGVDSISCRMYRSESEIFEGLRKNLLAGFNHSIPRLSAGLLFHLIVFVLPFFTLITSLLLPDAFLFFLSVGIVSIILLQRLIISTWFRWNPAYAFSHPIGILWFERLGAVKISDHLTGRKTRWKDREV
ncbi:MAG: glycosyltransferase family 2 protein [Balneolaceae bacterium]